VTVQPLTASSDAVTVGPSPAGISGFALAAGESKTFAWTVTGAKPGSVTLTAAASGTDGRGGTVTGQDQTSFPVVSAGPLTVKVEFQQDGTPVPESTVTLVEVAAGDVPQDVTAVITVTNATHTGQKNLSFDGLPPLSFHDPADARLPFPAAVTGGPLPPGPLPDLAGGESLTRSYLVRVTADGVLEFSPQILSTDEGSDATRVSQGVGTLLAPSLQVDWHMPSRVAASVESLSDAGAIRGLPKPIFVSPAGWKVSLLLRDKAGKQAGCPAGATYTWKVAAPAGAKVIVQPRPGCSTTMTVSRLGTYKATATRMV